MPTFFSQIRFNLYCNVIWDDPALVLLVNFNFCGYKLVVFGLIAGMQHFLWMIK